MEASYQRLLEDFPEAELYALWFAEAAEDAGYEKLSREYVIEALRREPNHPTIQAKARKLGLLP